MTDLLAELSAWLEGRLAEVHTVTVAKVVTFDRAGPRASVQPLLRRTYVLEDGTRTVRSMPQIERCPVVYPRGGGWSQTWPLAPGDLVLLLFAERSLDRWLSASDGAVELSPGDPRKHDLSDAIVLAGISPWAQGATVDAEDMVITREGGAEDERAAVRLKPNGEIWLSAGGDADQSMVRGEALVDWLTSHTHPTSNGPSGPPSPAPPAAVLSTKAKVR